MKSEKEYLVRSASELGILPGKNSLKTLMSRYLIVMGILMAALPPFFAIISENLGVKAIFLYISMPVLVFVILIFFIFYSIKTVLNPVKELLKEAKKLQEGELNIDLGMGGYEEINSLVSSVDRMRNSLYIAASFLGKRDRKKDRIIEKELARTGLHTLFLMPFLIYGITLTILGAVIYSEYTENIIGSMVPFWDIIKTFLMIFYALSMAAAIGFILSGIVGKPIRKLAIAAERASRGDMNADFSVSSNLGYLYELSVVLENLKNSLQRAMKEMEGID